MRRLTEKQAKILEFLRERDRVIGSAPTYREIADYFGFKSPKAATDHISALEKKGYVRRRGGRSRGIQLVFSEGRGDSGIAGIPLLGRIQAGRPWLETEEFQGALTIDLSVFGLSPDHRLFALRVAGDSMKGRGIHDGDMVVADADARAREGDVVVGLIDGENSLKTLSLKEGSFFLKSENLDYPDLIPIEKMEIQGVVRIVLRRMK